MNMLKNMFNKTVNGTVKGDKNGSAIENDNSGKNIESITRDVRVHSIRDERLNEETDQKEFLVKFRPVENAWIPFDVIDEQLPNILADYMDRKERERTKKTRYAEYEEVSDEELITNNTNTEKGEKKSSKSNARRSSLSPSLLNGIRRTSRQHIQTNRFATKSNTLSVKSKKGGRSEKIRIRKPSSRPAAQGMNFSGADESDDDEEEYKVEEILEKKLNKRGKTSYLIKWAGYDDSYNSWEPFEGLKHLSVIRDYEAALVKEEKNVDRNNAAKQSTTPSTPDSKPSMNEEGVENEEEVEDEEVVEKEEEYKVEKVLDKKSEKAKGKGKTTVIKYLIKWEGFDDSYNTWESHDTLKHLDIIKEYNSQQQTEKSTDRKSNNRKNERMPDEDEESDDEDDSQKAGTSKIPEKPVQKKRRRVGKY